MTCAGPFGERNTGGLPTANHPPTPHPLRVRWVLWSVRNLGVKHDERLPAHAFYRGKAKISSSMRGREEEGNDAFMKERKPVSIKAECVCVCEDGALGPPAPDVLNPAVHVGRRPVRKWRPTAQQRKHLWSATPAIPEGEVQLDVESPSRQRSTESTSNRTTFSKVVLAQPVALPTSGNFPLFLPATKEELTEGKKALRIGIDANVIKLIKKTQPPDNVAPELRYCQPKEHRLLVHWIHIWKPRYFLGSAAR